ncbi:hypothetical protein ACFVZH_36660 [Streptomyces sp. NPDC059534]|uniref:hypothetical protein n=1 Tax=Streptomyces sp. NPDC059534 TaxID=3346859 RepID=UPI0036A53A4E
MITDVSVGRRSFVDTNRHGCNETGQSDSYGNPTVPDHVPMHMDTALLTTGITVVSTVVLLFLGSWETERRNRRTEARKDAAADRAVLESQADELVEAVLALQIAGDTHDHIWASWAARGRLALRALANGSAAFGRAGGDRAGAPALLIAVGEASRVIHDWDQESQVSVAGLAAPLARLGAAVTPLLRREDLGPAAAQVYEAAVEHYGDDNRTATALSAFHEALRSALEPPAPTRRRRRFLRRRADREALPRG